MFLILDCFPICEVSAHGVDHSHLYNLFGVQGKTVPDWKCLLVKQKYFLGVWLNPGICRGASPFQDLGGTGRGTRITSHRDHSRAGSAGACHPRALPRRSPLSAPMTEQRLLCESSAGTKETANPAWPSRAFLSGNDCDHLSLNRAPVGLPGHCGRLCPGSVRTCPASRGDPWHVCCFPGS